MNLDEVVREVSQSNGRDMVLDLLRKGVGQTSEPPRRHPHAQVVSLDVTGVDVLRVGGAGNGVALASQAHSGAVPLLRAFSYAVDLNKHRVVDITTKRLIDRLDT